MPWCRPLRSAGQLPRRTLKVVMRQTIVHQGGFAPVPGTATDDSTRPTVVHLREEIARRRRS